MAQGKQPVDPRKKIGMLAELVRNARLIWRLLNDPRVSLLVKAIIPASAIYLLAPIDLIPDAFLGLGQLDDLAIILLGARFFLSLCPPEIVKEHLAEMTSVGVSYRVVDEDEGQGGTDQPVRYLEGDYRIVDDDNKSPAENNSPVE